MLLTEFDYNLPQKLIAEKPLSKRSDSRLLCLNRKTCEITHLHLRDLPTLLTTKDLIVLNNTKVIPARLYTHKPTGGKVEILLERVLENNKLLVQTRTSKSPKVGEKLILNDSVWFEIISRHGALFELSLHAPDTINNILEKFGQVPLPPYIKHKPTIDDKKHYQTIYAKYPGAVAAPTAGLHFDQELIQDLIQKKKYSKHIHYITRWFGNVSARTSK